MELKLNMYVRTEHGIYKINGYINNNYTQKFTYIDNKGVSNILEEKEIIKTSHNIIDLLEVGDYVNGEKITRVIPQDICGDEVLDYQHIFVNDKEIFKHEINSIVTKELFENIKYEVEK